MLGSLSDFVLCISVVQKRAIMGGKDEFLRLHLLMIFFLTIQPQSRSCTLLSPVIRSALLALILLIYLFIGYRAICNCYR